MLFSGPEILGPHNDVGKIVRSLSGPETPDTPNRSRDWNGIVPENHRHDAAECDVVHLRLYGSQQ